jgi:pimeloyl-ACP methyl ester carboxylesterase
MLAAARVGDGPEPVVLLHGFLGSGRNLGSFARRWSRLDPTRTFLLPDLPGHGVSPPVADAANLGDIAREVLETARAEGFSGKLDWVGHSFGGRVSLAAALVAPEAVRSVTLLDIAPGPIPEGTSESAQILHHLLQAPDRVPDRETMRRFLLDRGVKPAIAEWLLMNLVHTDRGYVWRIDRHALARLHERANRADLWEAVERPVAPVRCVRAERARYVDDADAERMRRAGCPVATIAGAGHFLHVDAPDALLELLTGRRAWS